MSEAPVHLRRAWLILGEVGTLKCFKDACLRLICVGVILPSVLVAGCQGSGSRSPGLRGFTLYNREAELELTYRQRNDVNEPRRGGGGTSEFKEGILEETLSLRTEGYLHHPTLLEFAAGTVLGLQQADFDQSYGDRESHSSSDGDIVEFDLGGTILKNKPYPTTFHARRSRSLVARPFRSSIESVSTNYGVTWQYVNDKMPVLLRYDFYEVNLDPFIAAGEVEGRRENTKFLFETGYLANRHNRLLFHYDRESIEEEPSPTQYDRDKLELTHTYEFGANHQHRLDSRLIDHRQRGTFASDQITWRERLSLRHTRKFGTSYQVEVTDRQQGSLSGPGSIDERSYQLSAALDHRLYDNLSSHFSVYYQDQRFEAGPQIERVGGGADFRYFRHNPWGVLGVNYRVGLDLQDTSGGEQQFEVIDEGRTFADPKPIILSDPNTQVSSIRLLRADRTEVYQRGRDYRLREIANRVEIERVVTGRIQDGETVLVSYRYRIGGAYELETLSQSLEIRQDFDFGLTPYYRLHRQTQTLRPVTSDSVIPEDITAYAVGADYVRGSLKLNAEYEDYDSSISPFVGYSLSADYSRRFASGGTGSFVARWSDLDFRGLQPRKTRLFTVTGGYKHPITPTMRVEGNASYRNQEDTISGDDEGVELDIGLEWFVRSTEFRVDYRFTMFEDDIVRRDSSTLFVQIKRRF